MVGLLVAGGWSLAILVANAARAAAHRACCYVIDGWPAHIDNDGSPEDGL